MPEEIKKEELSEKEYNESLKELEKLFEIKRKENEARVELENKVLGKKYETPIDYVLAKVYELEKENKKLHYELELTQHNLDFEMKKSNQRERILNYIIENGRFETDNDYDNKKRYYLSFGGFIKEDKAIYSDIDAFLYDQKVKKDINEIFNEFSDDEDEESKEEVKEEINEEEKLDTNEI